EYAVRLRRFHSSSPAYGYYDNYYTNTYWYTGNPYNYGTSVYMGYNFWGPSYAVYSYNPSFYWYSSWGWGYDPWYNPYSYNPYNPYGYYGYNPYMNGYYNGYNQGYWDGYHNGYGCGNNNYFNSYDNNSYYYGPRRTTGSNGRDNNQPLASRYVSAIETETQKPFEQTMGRDNNPHMLNTTVSDYYTTKPNKNNPAGQPIYINDGPVDNGNNGNNGINKPTDSRDKPVYNNNNNSEKNQPNPNTKENKPVYREKPVYNEKPAYNTPKDNRKDNNKPSYESKPRNDSPKQNNPSSAPRNQPNKSSSSPSKPPRR
ncbi:MAG: hypothetical protein M3R27_06865, partial [Bacteroidota bacterium]|nr:hypothetical protein [Bacteroidota bacterium]